MRGPGSGDSMKASARAFWLVAAAALLYASWSAWRLTWVCDDAFISFRYAENLVRGLGLVFNPAERVEGYSNFLWTLWDAVGLRLGADAERWSTVSGIACYAGALAVLAWNSWTTRGERTGLTRWVPIAALLGALLPDWHIFATSGLETALYTLEVTLIYAVLSRGEPGPLRGATAGLLLGMTAMTRPDGLIFAAAAGLFALLVDRRRPRTIAALAGAFLIVWVPYTAWRMSYYGDFFPNTYYAKSAAYAWYRQGAIYVCLYFIRYWPLLLGAVLSGLAWPPTARDREAERPALGSWHRSAALASMLSLASLAFVVYVGGDFMFGRFLIPVTPLLLILLELGIARFAEARPRTQWLLAGVATAGIVMTPYPYPHDPFASVRGIVQERNYYPPRWTEPTRAHGLALRPFFAGLPVRVAFFGSEARLIYYARPRVAIECTTGLTDRQIARQPLKKRTRIGHEKLASLDYLIGVRRAHFTFFEGAANVLRLDRAIPKVEIELAGVRGRILYWDPALLDSLRQRGASVEDFPAELDRLLEEPSLAIKWGGRPYCDNLRRFYFDHVRDPRREALLLQRLRENE